MEGDSENKWIENKLRNSESLAKRVLSVIDKTKSAPEKWFDVEKRVHELRFLLQALLCLITDSAKKSLYLRPVNRVLEEVEEILKYALDIASKFNLKSFIRRCLNTATTANFQTLFSDLDGSIVNMKWLLTVYDPKNNGAFDEISVFLPPIVNANPIFSLVWSCIATVQMGLRLNDRIDAIMSLASLAQDSDNYRECIVQEGGLPPLLKLLEGAGSPRAQIAAAKALFTLTNDPEIMKRILIVIVRLLKWKDAPVEVQTLALYFVSTMVELDAGAEYDSTEGTVIWPLVTLLSSETSADDPEIKGKRKLRIRCAEALWMLAARSVSNCRTITETKAMLCLARLVENERGKLQYYCLMTIMQITAAAESDMDFRQSVFKTNSPSAKAVVNQLLRVIDESEDPLMQIPAIRSLGSLARIFPRDTRVIGPLVSLLVHKHLTVATEAAFALQKFTSPENHLCLEHSKSVTESITFPASTNCSDLLWFARNFKVIVHK